MKKKVIIALAGLLVLLFPLIAIINLWRGERETITKPTTALQEGQTALHAQLLQGEQREAQLEKQYWDSAAQIRLLITAHQQRIDRLSGNSQAGEIVAHDRDAIARLEKRIADLEAQALAREAAAEEQAADEGQQAAQTPPAATH